MNKKILALLTGAFLSAMFLVGCGTDDNNPAPEDNDVIEEQNDLNDNDVNDNDLIDDNVNDVEEDMNDVGDNVEEDVEDIVDPDDNNRK